MVTQEAKLTRRIERLTKQLEQSIGGVQEHDKSSHFTYHGGFFHGYLTGKISIYQDLLDDLQEKE